MPLGQGFLSEFSDDGKRFVARWSTPSSPYDPWAIDAKTGKATLLRREARPSLKELPEMEVSVTEAKAHDGLGLPMNILLPKNRSGKLPVIVSYHGGPANSSRIRWSATTAFFLSQGYAWVEPNVRGSTGFGRAFEEADNGPQRLEAFKDIETTGRWVASQPWADPKRVIIYGCEAIQGHRDHRSVGGLATVGRSEACDHLRRQLRRLHGADRAHPDAGSMARGGQLVRSSQRPHHARHHYRFDSRGLPAGVRRRGQGCGLPRVDLAGEGRGQDRCAVVRLRWGQRSSRASQRVGHDRARVARAKRARRVHGGRQRGPFAGAQGEPGPLPGALGAVPRAPPRAPDGPADRVSALTRRLTQQGLDRRLVPPLRRLESRLSRSRWMDAGACTRPAWRYATRQFRSAIAARHLDGIPAFRVPHTEMGSDRRPVRADRTGQRSPPPVSPERPLLRDGPSLHPRDADRLPPPSAALAPHRVRLIRSHPEHRHPHTRRGASLPLSRHHRQMRRVRPAHVCARERVRAGRGDRRKPWPLRLLGSCSCRAQLLPERALEPLALQVRLGPRGPGRPPDQPRAEAEEDEAGKAEIEEEVEGHSPGCARRTEPVCVQRGCWPAPSTSFVNGRCSFT